VCEGDAESAAGACATSSDGDAGDGGDARATIERGADGAFRGPWHAPGSAGGPPDIAAARAGTTDVPGDDFEPMAGVDSCPAGWTFGNRSCDPALSLRCPVRTSALPGGSCTATGDDRCTSGAFPSVPSDATDRPVIHVSGTANPSVADGSRARPHATVRAAVSAAGARALILIAAGMYVENVAVTTDLMLVGTCPGLVILVGVEFVPTVEVSGSGRLAVRDLEIRDGIVGCAVRDGAVASLRNVRLVQTYTQAVLVTGRGSSATLQDVGILDTLSFATPGHGIHVEAGGSLTAERTSVSGSREAGVAARSSGTVRLTDSIVRNTVPPARDSTFGGGCRADGGARITLERTVVDTSTEEGVSVTGAGTELVVRDTVVSRTRAGATQLFGGAVNVLDGAHADLRHLTAHTLSSPAIIAGNGGSIDITDSTVRGVVSLGTHDDGSPNFGIGLVAQNGRLTATGVIVDEVEGLGALVREGGSVLRCTRCIIRSVRPAPGTRSGLAISVQASGRLELTQSAVHGGTYGLNATGAGSIAVVDRSLLHDTGALGANVNTTGVVVSEGARVELRHAHVANWNYVLGLAAEVGSTLDVSDSLLQSDPDPAHIAGAGVVAQLGASIVVLRTTVSSATGYGFSASGIGSTATVTASLAQGVHGYGSYEGVGIGAVRGARVDVVDSIVRDTRGAAALSQDVGSQLTVHGVLVDGAQAWREWRGYGIDAATGGRIIVWNSLVRRASPAGIICQGVASGMTLTDTWVLDTTASSLGLGFGVYASEGCHIDAERLAISGSAGSAIVAVSSPSVTLGGGGSSTINVTDLFVRDVSSSTLSLARTGPMGMVIPDGPAAAYGLHAVAASSIIATRASIVRGGRGIYSDHGAIRIDQGVIAQQLDGFAAVRGPESRARTSLVNVTSIQNADDQTLDIELFSASVLEPPTPVCADVRCP